MHSYGRGRSVEVVTSVWKFIAYRDETAVRHTRARPGHRDARTAEPAEHGGRGGGGADCRGSLSTILQIPYIYKESTVDPRACARPYAIALCATRCYYHRKRGNRGYRVGGPTVTQVCHTHTYSRSRRVIHGRGMCGWRWVQRVRWLPVRQAALFVTARNSRGVGKEND